MKPLEDLKKFLKTAKKPLIVILGPTASGKTAISLKVAHEIDGEIISTDSCQLYQDMEIATDALPEKDREEVVHHLIGILPPDKPINLSEYHDLAETKIKEIYARNHIPMLVGGTGLYISAITEGYQIPKVPPDKKLREKLLKEAGEKGVEFLHNKLKKLDPKAAEKIHPHNLRYVIRALEINLKTKNHKIDKKIPKSPYYIYFIGIEWPREKLYERVELRVDLQLKRGLVKEVQALLKKGYTEDLSSMSALGVKEIIPYLKGKMSLDECTEILKTNTRHYAKRQITWFRRYKNVHWIAGENLDLI